MKPVKVVGQVAPFRGTGRQLGYPTANIKTETDLAEGVYFGFADLADFINKPALIFIGVPTTVGDTETRLEVHVLDIPDEDYYDQTLNVSIEHFHRSNQHFASVEKLIVAIQDDDAQARKWFAKNSLAKQGNVRDT